MLYQKLLMNERPYFVSVDNVKGFEKHRHPDIEINYCLNGTYDIKINNTVFNMNEGDFIVIAPMASHEILENECGNGKSLTIVVGTTLLSEYFEYFYKTDSSNFFFHLNPKDNQNLFNLLCETAHLHENHTEFSELMIRGNLYKICAYILQGFISQTDTSHTFKNLRSVTNIEKALELIYYHYTDELRIEHIADLCGYSKSNFCKIFKNITGKTFHNFLNYHRVQVACDLLRETDIAVEDIAEEVGFADAKSLCRVFKQHMNCTPGNFRKKDNRKGL